MCKKKWASIRDQLRRTVQKRKSTSGQTGALNRKYKYEDILEFLIPHLGERDSLSVVFGTESEHQQDDDEIDSLISNTQEEQSWQPLNISSVKEELEIEDQNYFPAPTDDNNSVFSAVSSSSSSMEKDKFSRTPLKRKKSRIGKSLDSPASQLMAYILAEKQNENKIIRTSVQESEKHPVNAFLDGIAPTLKSLNPILLNQVKGRIFSLVQEYEMKQLTGNHYNDAPNPKPSTSNLTSYSPPQSITTNSSPYDSHIQTEKTNTNQSNCDFAN